MSRTGAILAIALLSGCAPADIPPDEEDQTKRTISLLLEESEKSVKRGSVPNFQLTIKNTGNEAERVIDLRDDRRADLQDTYYELEVTKGGNPVDVPRMISDPGPISDKDFVTLKSGETVTFDFSRFALALQSLPPGMYQARVRFWQDPYRSWKTSFRSPPAEFVVRR